MKELMLVGARRFVKSVCTGVILLDDVKVEGVDIVLCDVDDVARVDWRWSLIDVEVETADCAMDVGDVGRWINS